MEYKGTKRITSDKKYQRPDKTHQDNLTNQEIKEKLKEYTKIDNIFNTSIGTHIRYFTLDSKTNEHVFRLGGNLNKIDPQGRFIILSNGTITWSVQLGNSILYRKMTPDEIKEEIKNEVKKELLSEDGNDELKKELKTLTKKYLTLEKENSELKKENKTLLYKISEIQSQFTKNKSK